MADKTQQSHPRPVVPGKYASSDSEIGRSLLEKHGVLSRTGFLPIGRQRSPLCIYVSCFCFPNTVSVLPPLSPPSLLSVSRVLWGALALMKKPDRKTAKWKHTGEKNE